MLPGLPGLPGLSGPLGAIGECGEAGELLLIGAPGNGRGTAPVDAQAVVNAASNGKDAFSTLSEAQYALRGSVFKEFAAYLS
jgi:hypothetical protein